MNTFSAKEVVEQVEGLHTVKTLTRWRKAVEENFGISYFHHTTRTKNATPIRYSLDEVKRFQLVALILSGQPSNRKNLQQAIITAFESEEPFVKPKSEIEVLESALSSKIADLAAEDKRLSLAVQEINRRLARLEEHLSDKREKKSILFRRK